MEKVQSFEDTIGSLTDNQVRLLYRLMQSENRAGFAEESNQNNPIAILAKQGLVRKLGRVGNRHRWQVIEELGAKHIRDLIKDIVAVEGGERNE